MADADFSYIVSSLPDYVENNRELISQQIAFGTPTVKRVTPMNAKYKAAINMLSLSGSFQNGKGCATEYNSTATLTDREITTAILERKFRICPDTLIGKWPEYLVRIPADKRDSLPFEAFLVAEIITSVNDELETLIWQGKTSTYSGTDLINGYLVLAENDATVIDVTIAAGTSAWKAIKAVIAAVPAALRKKSVKVFVGPEVFTALAFELVDANLYHFAPEDDVESLRVPGTNVEVINTPGLAESDRIYASILDNMFYGTDDIDAQNRVKVGYNDEKGYFWANVRFNAGVNHAIGKWVVLGTIGGDLVSPDKASALEAIAANTAELADADHVYKTEAAE